MHYFHFCVLDSAPKIDWAGAVWLSVQGIDLHENVLVKTEVEPIRQQAPTLFCLWKKTPTDITASKAVKTNTLAEFRSLWRWNICFQTGEAGKKGERLL